MKNKATSVKTKSKQNQKDFRSYLTKENPIALKIVRDQDDSSSDEDNYARNKEDIAKITSYMIQQNKDIKSEYISRAAIMEVVGREIMYDFSVRQAFLNKKTKEYVNKEQRENTADQYKDIDLDIIAKIVKESFSYSFNLLEPFLSKRELKSIEQILTLTKKNIDKEDKVTLLKHSLKQCQREYLTSFFNSIGLVNTSFNLVVSRNKQKFCDSFSEKFNSDKREKDNIKLIEKKIPILQLNDDKLAEINRNKLAICLGKDDLYKLTPEKILDNSRTANFVKELILKEIRTQQQWKLKGQSLENKLNRLKNALQIPDSVITQNVKQIINSSSKTKIHATALKNFTNHCLKYWIDTYLSDGNIDEINNGYKNKFNKSPLKKIIDYCDKEKIVSVTNCKKNYSENSKEIEKKLLHFYNTHFAYNFSVKLNELMAAKKLLPELRGQPSESIPDSEEITNPRILFAKEHMLYNSTKRQSRTNEREVNKRIIFSTSEDLVVDKIQIITKAKQPGEIKESSEIIYRGTVTEKVLNEGDYAKINKIIDSYLKIIRDNNINVVGNENKYFAELLRDIFKNGITKLSSDHYYSNLRKCFTKAELKEFKQKLIGIVELFFGTEVWRAPATLAETNMMLDLIIAGEKTFEDALVNHKGNGGELSYTMKAKESDDKHGPIAFGRTLTSELNEVIPRAHKYGGPRANNTSKDYLEYIERKNTIAENWYKMKKPDDPISDRSFIDLIRAEQENWYGITIGTSAQKT